MPARDQKERIVVVGAGIGGLTTAALLARAGLDVTVLEAHVYPGGCAGTFYHKQYRFDAGATLAGGFYPGGPMDLVAKAVGIEQWPAHAGEPAMTVHLPGGLAVTRYGDERRWDEHAPCLWPPEPCFLALAGTDCRCAVGPGPAHPTVASADGRRNPRPGGGGLGWLCGHPLRRLNPSLAADALRPVAAHLAGAPPALRQFVDAQLLIAAQATSAHANALYGASALDLPRRGVVHLRGGIGAIAETLAQAVRAHGGKVLHRQEVTGSSSSAGGRWPSRPSAATASPPISSWRTSRRGTLPPCWAKPRRPSCAACPNSPRMAGARSWSMSVSTPLPCRRRRFSTTRWSSASRSPRATRSFCR